MKPTDVTRETIWEDGDVTEMARFLINGANATQSDVTSIARKIFDLNGSTPNTAESTTAPAVASTVFDTLQTDARWSKDATGYNFRERIAATNFPTAGHRYLVEYLFTGSGGEKFWIVFEHLAQSVRSS